MLRFIGWLSETLNSLVEKIVILLLSVVTILTITGVVTRYVFNFPIIWLYETTMVNFVWLVFLGMSVAFKRQEHIRLDFLSDRVPRRFSGILQFIICCIVVMFLLFGIKEGLQVVRDTATEHYHTINLSTAWFYASFPVSAVISCIHLLHEMLTILVKTSDPTYSQS
jgi:TRAP-type C4-dicarboxylate transport system permease small subunit